MRLTANQETIDRLVEQGGLFLKVFRLFSRIRG